MSRLKRSGSGDAVGVGVGGLGGLGTAASPASPYVASLEKTSKELQQSLQVWLGIALVLSAAGSAEKSGCCSARSHSGRQAATGQNVGFFSLFIFIQALLD